MSPVAQISFPSAMSSRLIIPPKVFFLSVPGLLISSISFGFYSLGFPLPVYVAHLFLSALSFNHQSP